MTSEEFWKDDPNLFASFRTFFINKKKREYEEDNYVSWLVGLYIHNGNTILTNKELVGISRMLGGKTQDIEQTYPTKPYSTQKEEEKIKNKEETKEQAHKEYFNSLNYFASLKQRFVEKVKKGE